MSRPVLLLSLVAVPLLLGACAGAPPARPTLTDADYPGLVRPPAVLGRQVVWRQRVSAAWQGGEGREGGQRGFDAVAQCQGETLTVLGLSPMGSVGFVVTLQGETLSLTNETGEPLPFPPRCVMLDFQRVHYPWVADPGRVLPDGEHVRELGGERVVERWQAGRPVERRFTRLDGAPAGELVVTLRWDRGDWWAPSEAVLDNRWFGYRLTVTTSEETRLPAAAAGDG